MTLFILLLYIMSILSNFTVKELKMIAKARWLWKFLDNSWKEDSMLLSASITTSGPRSRPRSRLETWLEVRFPPFPTPKSRPISTPEPLPMWISLIRIVKTRGIPENSWYRWYNWLVHHMTEFMKNSESNNKQNAEAFWIKKR